MTNASSLPLPEAGERNYWDETRRPWASLLFLLPLLVAYEAGVLWHAGWCRLIVRNGADHWLRTNLQSIHSQLAMFLPVIVVGVLLAWHLRNRDSWRIAPETFLGMTAESLLFALCLVFIGQLHEMCFRPSGGPVLDVTMLMEPLPVSVRVVSFLGAGVYEEFVFRLCLIPIWIGTARALMFTPRASIVTAVLFTSLVFSLAHHLVPVWHTLSLEQLPGTLSEIVTDPASARAFTFRTIAGVYFAGLFLARGFGVAVGCHALYDIVVGVLLS